MSYKTKKNLPGLKKGAKLLFDKVHQMFYVCKDNYADYYWFTVREVESGKKWFKKSLTIIFLFFSLHSFSQDTMKLWPGDEISVNQYEVQYSTDSLNWTTIFAFSKGKTYYTYVIEKPNGYYRLTGAGFHTTAAFLSFNSVTIAFPIQHTTNLTWITSNERNVDNYFIEKSRSGSTTWSKTTNFPAKGGGNYKYWISKTFYRYRYRISAIYKDGKKDNPINFQ